MVVPAAETEASLSMPDASAGTVGRPARTVALLAGSTSVLVGAALFGALLAFLEKVPCRAGAWNSYAKQFQDACYTDIYPLYFNEQLSAGKVPYTGHHVEYPVLIGGAMQAVAWLVHPIADPYTRGREFFDLTVVLLVICAVAGVVATAYAAGPARRWAALLVALSPALILSAFVNWDLIAMALAALAVAAWAGRRNVIAGVLAGLAVATKFYPLVFFGPLLLLCLRAGRMRAFWVTLGSAVVAWLVVNVPVIIVAPSGWATFYQFSRTRPADWGSIWYLFEHFGVPLLGRTGIGSLNLLSAAALALGCLAIAWLALAAPRRPRLPQLCFLVLAVFLMTNKVWSPQYVIWLVPFAVLARPRFWPYVLWQLAEVGYFFGDLGLSDLHLAQRRDHPRLQRHQHRLVLRGAAGAVPDRRAALRLRGPRHLRPDLDVVRRGGEDDPAGGVLAGAPDRFVLRLRRSATPAEAATVSPRPGAL